MLHFVLLPTLREEALGNSKQNLKLRSTGNLDTDSGAAPNLLAFQPSAHGCIPQLLNREPLHPPSVLGQGDTFPWDSLTIPRDDVLASPRFFLNELNPYLLLLARKGMAPPALLSCPCLAPRECSVNTCLVRRGINRAVLQCLLGVTMNSRPPEN